MIIVEGADNCGKSTLVGQLIAADPGLRLLHRDRFKPNQHETIATSYIKALTPPDGDRGAHGYSVADRFLASECIYGELFRGGCRMTPNEHFIIKSLLMSYNALIVFCNPPDHKILLSWSERDQLYDNDPLGIAKAYRKKLVRIFFPLRVWMYDWSAEDAKEQIRQITIEHQKRCAEYQISPWDVETCTGRRTA